MTEAIQRMSYDLMANFCPTMDSEKWRKMHGDSLAMCNRTGFGDTPRRDYINGVDLTEEYPRYDKCRTFQGSFIGGVLEGSLIVCTPGIHGIDATNPKLPSTAEIVARGWYSTAINTGNPPFHFRPNWGGFVAYPFIMAKVMKFESRFFARWDADTLPDPLRAYQ